MEDATNRATARVAAYDVPAESVRPQRKSTLQNALHARSTPITRSTRSFQQKNCPEKHFHAFEAICIKGTASTS